MPRKGENIYKRKDGRWEGRYIRSYDSEHKAKYAYVYGKTYSEVKRKLTEQRGNVQKVQPTKNKSSTYGELLDCWLHSMQLNTKESTQARYTHLIKTHIKPHLGAVQLSQLTTDAIEIFIEQQLTDGRLDNSGGLSPKTVTDILTIIKSTGIDDPLAHKVECSKRQYEANEGILISNPAKGTFYAEVYIYFESDGHRVYSDACRALLSNEPQKDVFYTLKYKKAGLFSKKCTLTVEIETEGACVFPSFAIVSKFKSTPLKRGDGDIVCTVNDNTEIKGSHTFEFDVSPMKADTRLKMFFLNDKNYKSFKIACKAGNNI